MTLLWPTLLVTGMTLSTGLVSVIWCSKKNKAKIPPSSASPDKKTPSAEPGDKSLVKTAIEPGVPAKPTTAATTLEATAQVGKGTQPAQQKSKDGGTKTGGDKKTLATTANSIEDVKQTPKERMLHNLAAAEEQATKRIKKEKETKQLEDAADAEMATALRVQAEMEKRKSSGSKKNKTMEKPSDIGRAAVKTIANTQYDDVTKSKNTIMMKSKTTLVTQAGSVSTEKAVVATQKPDAMTQQMTTTKPPASSKKKGSTKKEKKGGTDKEKQTTVPIKSPKKDVTIQKQPSVAKDAKETTEEKSKDAANTQRTKIQSQFYDPNAPPDAIFSMYVKPKKPT